MKIMMTGGTGMVGRNLISQAKSIGLDVLAPGRSELDLFDKEAICAYMRLHKPDIVIHAAGLVGGIQANIRAPFDFCYVNLQIGINVLHAAFESNVSKLLNFGSSCMYPRFAENPLKESAILTGELEPTNEGYGLAKITVAKMTQYLSQQYGVEYKTILPCNLYGLWDKFDPVHSHMIPAVIRKIHEALQQRAPWVDIWGDGLARREFLFAGDLADFVCSMLPTFDKLPICMNVGLGRDYSINEYYDMVKSVLGYTGDFKHDLTKPSGMKQKLVDVSIQQSLGWYPKTDILEGIARTYDYFLSKDY